ncbi:hypothetical protein JCM8097_005247 [Rhodosporidiobolus ruineniae]
MAPLPELLEHLHTLDSPYSPYFDDRLLISLLLAFAAGHQALVVRLTPPQQPHEGETEQERRQRRREVKEQVKRVADEIQWICSTIFARTTHPVSCSPKTPSHAFLRSLFLPNSVDGDDLLSPGKDGYGSIRRAQKRSASAPLGVLMPGAAAGRTEEEARLPRSPGFLEPPAASRRQQNASDPVLYPTSPSHLTFEEPQRLQHREAEESSAGEDLYPTSTTPRRSLDRRATLSPKLRTDSPDRRKSGGRRHTLGAKDLLRPSEASQSQTSSLVGLGLGGSSKSSAGAGATPPRLIRPSSPRSPTAGSGFFAAQQQQRSPSMPSSVQHSSAYNQSERRPSIASVQSAFSTNTVSTATPPTPTPSRFLAPSSQHSSALNVPHVASPLVTSPSFTVTPTRSSSPSTASRLSTATAKPHPSVTYPPITRPSSAATGSSTANTTTGGRSLPQVLILEHLERARPSVQQTLMGVLRDRRVSVAPSSNHGGNSAGTSLLARRAPAAGGGAADDASLRTRRTTFTVQTREEAFGAGGEGGSWNLPEGFLCVAVLVDEEEEEREDSDGGWGGVCRYLLDHFSLSHTVPPSSLSHPSRFRAPPPPPLHPHPLAPSPHSLLSPLPLPPHALPTYLSDTLDTYLSDLLSALRHHPQVEGRMVSSKCRAELEKAVRVWVGLTKGEGAVRFVPPGEDDSRSEEKEKEMDGEGREEPLVLPSDVLAVLLSTVGHRLVLRKPRDEKSLFWGSDRAALEARRRGDAGERRKRRTVEEVVREVVAIV